MRLQIDFSASSLANKLPLTSHFPGSGRNYFPASTLTKPHHLKPQYAVSEQRIKL